MLELFIDSLYHLKGVRHLLLEVSLILLHLQPVSRVGALPGLRALGHCTAHVLGDQLLDLLLLCR